MSYFSAPIRRQRFVRSIVLTSLCHIPLSCKTKNVLDRNRLSVKDEQVLIQYDTIRGATLLHDLTRALKQDTNISSAFIRLPAASQNTLKKGYLSAFGCSLLPKQFPFPFDCALSGPFDNLFPVCFSASQTLCMGIIAVISASTV